MARSVLLCLTQAGPVPNCFSNVLKKTNLIKSSGNLVSSYFPEGFAVPWKRSGKISCLASGAREVLGSRRKPSVFKFQWHTFGNTKEPHDFVCREVPNRLKLVREKPSGDVARRYRNARSQQALYRAASQLWMRGVPISQAIQIVTEAVDESMHQ